MSDAKFTPGPWTNVNGLVTGWDSKHIGVPSFDIFNAAEWPGDPEEGRANAKLIAAAPDMLAALKNIENDDGHMPRTAWEMIQAAIAKAEGQ